MGTQDDLDYDDAYDGTDDGPPEYAAWWRVWWNKMRRAKKWWYTVYWIQGRPDYIGRSQYASIWLTEHPLIWVRRENSKGHRYDLLVLWFVRVSERTDRDAQRAQDKALGLHTS